MLCQQKGLYFKGKKIKERVVKMKKIKYVALVLVLAFGLIGGAYAAWTDSLGVGGTVATGDIDVQFVDAVLCFDQDKDVATGEVKIIEEGKKLEITIDNYYPDAGGVVYFYVENKGSVPVKMDGDPIIGNEYEDELTVANCWWWPWCPCICCDDDDDSCAPDWDYQQLEDGVQLGNSPQCDSTKAQSLVTFDVAQYVNDEDTMDDEFTFTISYNFIQWNFYDAE